MATLEQEGYRWRNDDGDEGGEGGATWLEAQDTNITRWRNTNTRLRVLVDATGDPDPAQFRLEYRKKGTSDWYVVGTGDDAAVSSPSASLSPSISPSMSPSVSPSVSPSQSPSLSPSASLSPSVSPSVSPSLSPSISPSISPSLSPSESPSISPSVSPSLSPSASISPSKSPSVSPSISPSISPSLSPSASISPSRSPSLSPSISPSKSPSVSPSLSPSASISPSRSPSKSPSVSPSLSPSASISPSKSPSKSPSVSPSVSPSISPSQSPSASPSGGGTCPAEGSPDYSMTVLDNVLYWGATTDDWYAGTVWIPTATKEICRMRFCMSRSAGNLDGLQWVPKIWDLTTTDPALPANPITNGTGTTIVTAEIYDATWYYTTFGPPYPTMTNGVTYAITLDRGAVGTNLPLLIFSTADEHTDSYWGKWKQDKTLYQSSVVEGRDIAMEIYYYD